MYGMIHFCEFLKNGRDQLSWPRSNVITMHYRIYNSAEFHNNFFVQKKSRFDFAFSSVILGNERREKREKKRFLEFGHSVKCQYFPAIFGAFFLSKDMTFEPYL